LSADGRCRPLSLIVTAEQRADCTQFVPVLETIRVPRLGPGRPRKKPAGVAADKGYGNGPCREYLRRRGIRHTVPDPSKESLFMLISDLNRKDNTFVVVQPDEDDPVWFASVALLDEGGYEVARDASRREHDVAVEAGIGRIAGDLTRWLAARVS
jgi:hypothetical protein